MLINTFHISNMHQKLERIFFKEEEETKKVKIKMMEIN